jgi:hypothetical protein
MRGLNNIMTKTKLKWRLGRLPEPQEIALLLEKELLTKEEAREILFSQGKEDEKDTKALESEIKFLRELVEKLSNNNQSRIVEVIREVQVPYIKWGWYQPYQYWCSSTAIGGLNSQLAGAQSVTNLVGSGTAQYTVANSTNSANMSSGAVSFKNIKTF